MYCDTLLYQYIAMYCDVLMYCATGALTPRACEYTSKIHQFLRRRECLTCSRLLQNAPYWYQDGPLCLGTLPPNIPGHHETFASLPQCVPKPLVAKLVDHARGRQRPNLSPQSRRTFEERSACAQSELPCRVSRHVCTQTDGSRSPRAPRRPHPAVRHQN